MGYSFKGVFSSGDPVVMTAILDRWSFCTGKVISLPFQGFGIRCPDPDREAQTDEEYETLSGQVLAFEQAVRDLSAEFIGSVFVFVHADCFGGNCVYRGFVARDGRIEQTVDAAEPGLANLERLLLPLGVKSVDPFPPFARGYWDEAGTPGTSPSRQPGRAKNICLLVMLVVNALCGALFSLVPEEAGLDEVFTIVDMVLILVPLLVWCVYDGAERAYRPSKALLILIILFAAIGLPVYFFRTRGAIRGFFAIVLAAAFFLLLMIVSCAAAFAAAWVRFGSVPEMW